MKIREEIDRQKLELDLMLNEKVGQIDALDYEALNELRFEYELAAFKLEVVRKQLEIEEVEKMLSKTVEDEVVK